MANLNKKNVSEAEETLLLASKDLIAFGKLFLPDDFMRSETPAFHYEMADAIDDHECKQLAIILPRGHGKTVLTKASIIKDFVYCPQDDMHFYAWVAATQKLSVGNMDYIKYHLEFNDSIKYYFGNLKGRKWTEEDIELSNGCKLISKSNVAGIRGGAKLHRRYDLIILDDFEHEQNTITSEARAKNANLVTAVVYPALEPHTGRLRVNGTPVHYDSFINNLIINYERYKKGKGDDFSWRVITYKAIQKDGTPLWASWFPLDKLEEKKKFYRDSGTPSKFFQEYMMEVQSEEDSVWTRKHIKHWEGFYKRDDDLNYIVIDGEKLPVNIFIGCDPATDIDTKESDFSVIMVIAVDCNNNLYVLEYERHRAIPTIGAKEPDGKIIDKKGVVDYIIDLYNKYKCTSATVEDVAMNRSIFQALNDERRRINRFDIAVIPEKPGGTQKRNRIYSGLSGRFSMGTVHIRENMFDLINEILTFGPRMAHDDTIEALFYANLHSFPANYQKDGNKKDPKWYKPTRKAKSWIVA